MVSSFSCSGFLQDNMSFYSSSFSGSRSFRSALSFAAGEPSFTLMSSLTDSRSGVFTGLSSGMGESFNFGSCAGCFGLSVVGSAWKHLSHFKSCLVLVWLHGRTGYTQTLQTMQTLFLSAVSAQATHTPSSSCCSFLINVLGKALLVSCPGFLEVIFSFLEVQTGGLVAFLHFNLYCLVV
jgi:hypothetical protein